MNIADKKLNAKEQALRENLRKRKNQKKQREQEILEKQEEDKVKNND